MDGMDEMDGRVMQPKETQDGRWKRMKRQQRNDGRGMIQTDKNVVALSEVRDDTRRMPGERRWIM